MSENEANDGGDCCRWGIPAVALKQPFFGSPTRSVSVLALVQIVCAHLGRLRSGLALASRRVKRRAPTIPSFFTDFFRGVQISQH